MGGRTMGPGDIVCVLPWLTLQEPLTLNGLRFETFSLTGRRPGLRPSPDEFAQLAVAYRDGDDHELKHWTLVSRADESVSFVFAESEEASVRLAALRLLLPLLTGILPGLEDYAGPQNRNGGYINAEALEAHIYPAAVLCDTPRRKVEHLLGIDVCKLHAGSRRHLEVKPSTVLYDAPKGDQLLACALDAAGNHSSVTLERLDASLPFLHEVLRDRGRYLPHAVAMAAAGLGRIFNGDGAACFAERIGTHFGRFGSIRVGDSGQCRFKAVKKYATTQRSWWLMQAWAYNLYETRNNVMHPIKTSENGWDPEEHLLVFRWMLPSLIKVMLESEGHYALDKLDHAELWMFDRWLSCPRPWFDESTGGHIQTSVMRGIAWGSLVLEMGDLPAAAEIRIRLAGIPVVDHGSCSADDDLD